MSRWPELQFQPETVKAIIMAAATNNIEGRSRLSTKDGAGGINANRTHTNMRAWWWEGNHFGSNKKQTFSLGRLKRNQRARLVVVWSTHPTYSRYSSRPSIDMDLTVYDPNGRRIAVSASWDNTYEIVQFNPRKTGTYRARIKVFRHSKGRYKYGAALVRNVRIE